MSNRSVRDYLRLQHQVALVVLLTFCLVAQGQSRGDVTECVSAQPVSGAVAAAGRESLARSTGTSVVAGPVSGNQVATRRADRYRSAVEAAELAGHPTTALVDVRRPARFEELRVPGSMNIPGFQIKTKGFLRGKRLLLLGDGHSYRALDRLADDLQTEGFDQVSIVEGGLNAWRLEVGALEGAANPNRAAMISPSEYLQEQRYGHWKLVFVGLDNAAADASLLSRGAVISDPGGTAALATLSPGEEKIEERGAGDGIPFAGIGLSNDTAPDAIRSRLTALARADGNGLKPLVLIASADGEGYPRIQAIMKEAGLWNLFYLEGGDQAYARHISRIQAMRTRDRRPRGGNPGSCAARR